MGHACSSLPSNSVHGSQLQNFDVNIQHVNGEKEPKTNHPNSPLKKANQKPDNNKDLERQTNGVSASNQILDPRKDTERKALSVSALSEVRLNGAAAQDDVTPPMAPSMMSPMNQQQVTGKTDGDKNVYKPGSEIPKSTWQSLPVDFPYLTGFSHGKWPIRNQSLVGLNVNAKHGGCATLLVLSNAYGGKGEETTAELAFLRSGFSSNHYGWASIIKDAAGHFGAENRHRSDEGGDLLLNSMFGTNHASLFSSDACNGNVSHGVFIEGSREGDEALLLPVKVNVGQTGEGGSGTVLVLCTGFEAGVDGSEALSASYMVRLSHKADYMNAKVIKGEDKWKFGVDSASGRLTVTGPNSSKYGIFHNRDQILDKDAQRRAKVYHTQALIGCEQTVLMTSPPSAALLFVLCSSSRGDEDATSAALYSVNLYVDNDGKSAAKSVLLTGLVGEKFGSTEVDLYKIEISGQGQLVISGPEGPCKYCLISNLSEDLSPTDRCQQIQCLATSKPKRIYGVVAIEEAGVRGWVSESAAVDHIRFKIDEVTVGRIFGCDLIQSEGRWVFQRAWREGERAIGLRMIRVFAVIACDKGEIEIELEGSPTQLIEQCKGVIYALNIGSGAYQALNDITYTSEHHQYASYTNGSRYTCMGNIKPLTSFPQLFSNTYNGFLYAVGRHTYPEPIDEKYICYDVKDLPNGKHTLRLHTQARSYTSFTVNKDSKYTSLINSALKNKADVIGGYTGFQIEVPVNVTNHTLSMDIREGWLSAFAVLNDQYKEKQPTQQYLMEETKVKQQLADKLDPLNRSFLKKKLTIVGWSQNLLQNGSAEMNSTSHWNTRGDWQTTEGGFRTERAFKTSHMDCVKYQEVDLTEFFKAEYLDTAPDIQITEWYREGVCGGGFYTMDAALMTANGETVKSYTTGRIGTIYKQSVWQEATVTFSNYGPGVRHVSIQSTGKDDKYWGGHYGVWMCAAVIRVKRETKAAESDAYEDIADMNGDEENRSLILKSCDSVVAMIIINNQDILDSLEKKNAKKSKETEIDIGKAQSGIFKEQRVMQKRKKREIRVFVSSTFRDFINEREQLIKKTFREINKYCADRGVFFTYVDLRWGITEDQTNHGKTIAICLKEIERCHYFICLMGERFGWCQRNESPDTLLNNSFDYAIENHKQLSWLNDHRYETSVTQLEIMHGVLNDLENAKESSFFYLRDPVNEDKVDAELYKRMSSESEWHKEKQEELRKRVCDASLNIRKYDEVDRVTSLIKEDLLAMVDKDFPAGTELTPLEREREAHLAFAEARRRVYIGGEDYFRQMDEFVSGGKDVPLVLLGESGSGKSSLVANWVGKFEEKNQHNCFLFFHFIGSSAESASYIKLLRRLYSEMKDFFGFNLEVPNTDTVLVQDLSKWLRLASHSAKCVIVLDALNQLDDGSGEEGPEHDLLWLPKELPQGVILILSTLPGRAFEAVKSAGWPSLTVTPLDPADKSEIITGYMEGIYGKTMSDDQKQMIVNAPQTNNPLYLKALLDELRMYGSFRLLSDKIQDYLSASTPRHLFAKILERLEQDFEQGLHVRPGLVRETTCALWCSHRGMTESELLEYLEVPSPVWSPFYLSLIENLVNRNGIVNFFHDHLRQAVEAKYLPTAEAKQESYKKLAKFFSEKELDDRVVEELPYVLAKAGELEKLKETIVNLEVFKRLIKNEDGKFDLITSWKILGGIDQAEAAYMEKLKQIPAADQQREGYKQLVSDLAQFFVDLGLLTSARDLFEELLVELEEGSSQDQRTIVYSPYDYSRVYRSKDPAVIDVLYNLGRTCEKQGSLDQALKYYTDAVVRQNRVETPAQKLHLAEGLLGMATVQTLQQDMKEAKKCLIRSREIATDVLGERHHYVTAVINKLGQLAYQQGLIDEAKLYLVLDLSMTRGDVGVTHPRTAGILNDLALVYDDQNDAEALPMYQVALRILTDTYGPSHIDIAYVRYNLGAFFYATNYFARAKYQFTESHRIFLAFVGPDHKDTIDAKLALDEVSQMV